MNDPQNAGPATSFRVAISQDGPGGGIFYRETGVGEFETWWEFASGHGVLAIVSVPPPARWDARVPWAGGRRGEVLARVASEIVRQKAAGCLYEIGDDFIEILSG